MAGALFIATATPLYSASTQLLIEIRQERAIGADATLTPAPIGKRMMKSEIAVIKSAALLRRVVEREKLIDDPELGAATIAATIERLKNALAVTLLRNSRVIQIAVTSMDPAKAARLADAIADAYVVDKLDARLEAARRASAWLADRLVALRRQSHNSEEALALFLAATGASARAEGMKIDPEQSASLARRVAGVRAEAAERKARLELLQRIEGRGGNAAELPGVGGAIDELRRRAAQLSRQEAELRSRYTDGHPSVVALRAQIADVDRAIATEVRRLSVGVRHAFELAEGSREAAETTLRDITATDDRGKSAAIMRGELERAAATDRKLLENMLRRARLVQEQSTFEPRVARIISAALAPSAPIWPDNAQTMLIALALGVIAGVGAAYASELADKGFTTLAQIEAKLALPLLASISEMKSHGGANGGVAPILADYLRAKPLSRAGEAFRALRSAIAMSDVDDPPKLIQLTSTVPGEGTTTIASALAASAAQSGLRTLLVDADLRHRAASRIFSAGEKPGLVDLLIGSAQPSATIFFDDKRGIWVLPAGAEIQNSSDLLASEKMKALVAALRRQFDLVVIDTPPIGPVLDPLIVAGLVDRTVLVIRWAATPREAVAHAIERLPERGKIAGAVFNLVIEAKARKYGRYAYSPYSGAGSFENYHVE
ncbi:polysaccharide biosynthesis tyrosine autokinase [Methylosinus sp. H3A]|uniref:GumC family protein n=1 Tax=Methylosinus sp. H3A TaxID=2785786 RepID=UPI0018C25AA8|nr:polysaccharide biosynthesis tyrosine autokinase [Methylosinus sp. H3A]MBG0811737.1 polysaccharide biosynthesis tyrosine autokinase [Methylosinus sp. H3A]